MTGLGEIEEGGGGVILHGLLGGVEGEAGAVAAVIDGEDVDVGLVEEGDERQGGGEGGAGIVEEEDGGGGLGGCGGGAFSGNPPGGEAGRSGGGGIETERGEGDGGGGGGGGGGVEDHLTGAHADEQAECEVAKDGGGEDGEGEGAEEPAGVYVLIYPRWFGSAAVAWGGGGHEGTLRG